MRILEHPLYSHVPNSVGGLLEMMLDFGGHDKVENDGFLGNLYMQMNKLIPMNFLRGFSILYHR